MVHESIKKQSIKGEIEYRRKLVKQQILGREHHFDDHGSSLDEVYESWMKPQIEKLEELLKNVSLSQKPSFFLEVGSENSHLSIYLMKKYDLDGVCVDLSFDTLHLGVPRVSEKIGAKKKPYLVVADVHNLPFNTASFNFVFSFGSLHHFYHLKQAVTEIRRVCATKGVFISSYDPLKPLLRPKLKETCSEVSYGILENSYTLPEYTRPLKQFFSNVKVIYPKSAYKLDMYSMHRVKRLKENIILSKIESIIPQKVSLVLRLLWFGLDDFTSVSIA